MSQGSVIAILDLIEGGGIKDRNAGLSDLRTYLRQCQRNSRGGHAQWSPSIKVFEVLCRVISSERSASLKSSVNATKAATSSAAAARLSACASTLRLAVEVACPNIKHKSVLLIITHVRDNLLVSNGVAVCEPLALDLLKSMASLFSYQPHVEHLPLGEWRSICVFLVTLLRSLRPHDETSSSLRLSRSASNTPRTETALQDSQRLTVSGTLRKPLCNELLSCLRGLTASPTAPLHVCPETILPPLTAYLMASESMAGAELDAITVIADCITVARTDALSLVQSHLSILIKIIHRYWNSKSVPLKEQLLRLWILIEPYCRRPESHYEDPATLQEDWTKLYEAIIAEQISRSEREVLQIHDLHFYQRRQISGLQCRNFSLRDHRPRAEQSWSILALMTTCFARPLSKATIHSFEESDSKSSKRQRTASRLDDLVTLTRSRSTVRQTVALQLLVFFVEQDPTASAHLQEIVQVATSFLGSEIVSVACWAFLLAASCTTNPSVRDHVSQSCWLNVWQTAARLLSTPSRSRIASYSMFCILSAKLLPQEFYNTITSEYSSSLEVNSPATCNDASCALLAALLSQAYRSNVQSGIDLAQRVLPWLLRQLDLNEHNDHSRSIDEATPGIQDIISLVGACYNQKEPYAFRKVFQRWHVLAQTWIVHDETRCLVDYLLLQDNASTSPDHEINIAVTSVDAGPIDNQPLASISHISTVLSKLLMDAIKQATDALSRDHIISPGQWSEHYVIRASTLLYSLGYLIDTASGQSDVRSDELGQSYNDLVKVFFARSTTWTQATQDAVNVTIGIDTVQRENGLTRILPFFRALSQNVFTALDKQRLKSQELKDIDGDDLMVDSNSRSQASQLDGAASSTLGSPCRCKLALLYDAHAQRLGALLYFKMIDCLSSESEEHCTTPLVSYITSLEAREIVLGGSVFDALKSYNEHLIPQDLNDLLEYLSDTVLNDYALKSSETGICLILDVLLQHLHDWTDHLDKKLYDLGLDLYEFLTTVALPSGTLSTMAQKRLSMLLIRLWGRDKEYGRKENLPSVRTILFSILRDCSIPVKYYLADHIGVIFKLYPLPVHDALFDDLQNSLPSDADCIEGLALRILVLARLGTGWQSLLRKSIYYIFDAAGQISKCAGYAIFTIRRLSEALGFADASGIFRLFRGQLLYTWLGVRELQEIPFQVFGYIDLDQLLEDNTSEVVAQLLLHDKLNGLELCCKLLQTSQIELLKMGFAQAIAYAIGQDVTSAAQGQATQLEAQIRDLIQSKSMYLQLVKHNLPSIAAQFFISMELDGGVEKALSKKRTTEEPMRTLEYIKSLGSSKPFIGATLQPSFRSRGLVDQLERLCRRANIELLNLFTVASFTDILRQILDTINPVLGLAHSGAVFQKIRLLIAFAPKVACQGYPVEMLLHALRPYAVNALCARDVLGLLHFLCDRGLPYLHKHIRILLGTTLILLLELKAFPRTKPDTLTQESQVQDLRTQMLAFSEWLADQTLSSAHHVPASEQVQFQRIMTSCRDLSLPATLGSDEPGGTFLQCLLDDVACPLLNHSDRRSVLAIFLGHAEPPQTRIKDLFGADDMAVTYGLRLWESASKVGAPRDIIKWTLRVFGRGLSADRSLIVPRTSNTAPRDPPENASSSLENTSSITALATELLHLLWSPDRQRVSIAERTLRRVLLEDTKLANPTNFGSLLPTDVIEAFSPHGRGSVVDLGENIILVPKTRTTAAHDIDVSEHLHLSFKDWILVMVRAIVRINAEDPVLGALPELLTKVPELGQNSFPVLVHLGLLHDSVVHARNQKLLITACQAIFSPDSGQVLDQNQKSRSLLVTLEYLLRQPIASESVRSDRLKWLDVDYIRVAFAALSCDMPITSLYLLEYSRPWESKPSSRRTSASRSEIAPTVVHQDLFLQIFKKIDDPDSFYGVDLASDLKSVLTDIDHEQDGQRALMLHTAQVDASLRIGRSIDSTDRIGMVNALSVMELNSASYMLTNQMRTTKGASPTSASILQMARKLGQWDIPLPRNLDDACTNLLTLVSQLHRSVDLDAINHSVDGAFTQTMLSMLNKDPATIFESKTNLDALGILTEIEDLTRLRGISDFDRFWEKTLARRINWNIGNHHEYLELVSYREAVFGAIRQNSGLQNLLKLSHADACKLEMRVVRDTAEMARKHGQLQQALVAATFLTQMAPICADAGLKVDVMVDRETASVLWAQGITHSIKMLRGTCSRNDFEKQSIPVGRAGILAQLGHQIAEARLEKPDDIIKSYLKPAISQLQKTTDSAERGQVHFEFATFCDKQLASDKEDFRRLETRRNKKRDEILQLETLFRSLPAANVKEKQDIQKSRGKAKNWYALDDREYKEAFEVRKTFVQQSLSNYLQAFQACDDYDTSVLRFFALWLEHADSESGNQAVSQHINGVASRKFALLLNQLMSSLQQDATTFQTLLAKLVVRFCVDHPYHGIYQLFLTCNASTSDKDDSGKSRKAAAVRIAFSARSHKHVGVTIEKVWEANELYHRVAVEPSDAKTTKPGLRSVQSAYQMNKRVTELGVPPATITLPIRADCDYSNVPIVVRYRDQITIASGLSAPKILTARGSDGLLYKQLFKGGNDDLRQDAIMEQVFAEVSKMLRNHKATQQRDLHIRTYKVLPLTSVSGIIEFVRDSIPLNDVLVPAHVRYHPQDLAYNKGREMIRNAQQSTKEQRVAVYRSVTKKYSPVLRHFFFERFQTPDEWFKRRLAYTRSTAAISILGHVLGLGDRHCHNILLDEKSGEVIHIDLGVAFETGRILPVPETVPFRLTRDIVDGMGITGTEGVFRRCCEFTTEALREDKDSIMTLLNVLRYDPLYSWTVSPLRARRMQKEDQDQNATNGTVVDGMTTAGATAVQDKREDASEAERALDMVEKKLSKSLSAAATVNELIQQATDERNLAVLFAGWAAFS